MSIEISQIATNRNAPIGYEAINLYSTGAEGGSNLTLGQLVIAVSVRSAAVYEAQSVIKMNMMTAGSTKLDTAAKWLEKIADGSADWAAAKSFGTNVLGIENSTLPSDLQSYDKRMQAATAFKAKMDALAQTQQQEMIDLQTLVNRRDVAYSTSSNIVRALGTSQSADAANF
jgi:hypothetical protein